MTAPSATTCSPCSGRAGVSASATFPTPGCSTPRSGDGIEWLVGKARDLRVDRFLIGAPISPRAPFTLPSSLFTLHFYDGLRSRHPVPRFSQHVQNTPGFVPSRLPHPCPPPSSHLPAP